MVYSEQVDDVFVLVLLIVTHADKKVLVYCKGLTTTSEYESVKPAVSPWHLQIYYDTFCRPGDVKSAMPGFTYT